VVDNTDFAEYTADGKGNTRGTITVVYQKENAPGEVIVPSLEVSEAKNLTVTPYNVPISERDLLWPTIDLVDPI